MTLKKDGFEGPASPKVDYTGSIYYVIERESLEQLRSWLQARFLFLKSPMLFRLDEAFRPLSILTREVISFHSISKPWGHLKWKIFVKEKLVGACLLQHFANYCTHQIISPFMFLIFQNDYVTFISIRLTVPETCGTGTLAASISET